MIKNHKHNLRVSGWTGRPDGPYPFTISFRCSDFSCDERAERIGTRDEFEKLYIEWDEEKNVHTVAYAFDKEFRDENTGTWKLVGYELMKAVEEWAKKYSDYVHVVTCNDMWFCGSDVVLIEHRTDTLFMGTSLIYIPQHSGGANDNTPSELFLYPYDHKELMHALSKIWKRRNKIRKTEIKAVKKRAEMLDTIKQ